jgi:cellobiose-specific phosphotransferase system component IIA
MTKDEALKRALNSAYDVRRDWRKWNAAFLSSLRESGWTLAPVEATEIMINAAYGWTSHAATTYRIMLTAQEGRMTKLPIVERLKAWPNVEEAEDADSLIEESADYIEHCHRSHDAMVSALENARAEALEEAERAVHRVREKSSVTLVITYLDDALAAIRALKDKPANQTEVEKAAD